MIENKKIIGSKLFVQDYWQLFTYTAQEICNVLGEKFHIDDKAKGPNLIGSFDFNS